MQRCQDNAAQMTRGFDIGKGPWETVQNRRIMAILRRVPFAQGRVMPGIGLDN